MRKFWRVGGDFGECLAETSGKLRLAADEGADWPAVGDWVVVELQGADTTAVINEVLPRRSKLVRKSPGKRMEEQVIAANVDTALLVSALDGDFNPSFDLKLGVLSLIFSDNRGRNCFVSERSDQASFSANLGWECLGKIYPAGISDEHTGTIVRVFRREV
jgi:hypothetical protein